MLKQIGPTLHNRLEEWIANKLLFYKSYLIENILILLQQEAKGLNTYL